MRWMLAASLALAACATTSSEPAATTLPPHRPWNEPREQLDKGDIIFGMAQIKPVVMRCFDRYRTTGFFSAAFTIVGDGHIASVHVRGPHVETNDCIGHAVASATFPSFSGAPQSIVYPFMFR